MSSEASVSTLEPVEVGHVAHHARRDQAPDDLVAQPLDVHRASAGEVQQPLVALRRARHVGAPRGDLTLLAPYRSAAAGARGGHDERTLASVTQPFDGTHDLGDDVAGLAHDDRVADEHALAPHLVFVMQRRPLDGRPRDLHRLEDREGCEHAGAAHAHLDVEQPRGLLLGRELVGDRPARRLGRVAQLVLERELVDFDHHAVYLVGQRLAHAECCFAELADLLGRGARDDVGVHVEAGRPKPLEHLALAREPECTRVRDRVDERRQIAPGGDRRVLLPHRAGGGVAGIGEERQPGGLLLGVEALEARSRQVDLAPDLDRSRSFAGEPQRYVPDHLHVSGDVLTGGAVTSGRGTHEHTVLVGQSE